MSGKREYGDYQTPVEFAEKVCFYLDKILHVKPTAVIEPTCGEGSFLKSSLLFNAKEYYGIEINSDYCQKCSDSIKDNRVKIINSDFFSFSLKSLIKDKTQILVIGNPPWVTNSTLSVLSSQNLPTKGNFKRLKGIEAITGASNFDICEYIILKIIEELKNTNAIISMLCKTSVARNIFKELKRKNVSFISCDILEFDSAKVFNINASACVLVIRLSDKTTSSNICNVYDFDNPEIIKSQFGYSNGMLYSELDSDFEIFDGRCCFEWRQGVKHDCSKIMELSLYNGMLQNGLNQNIQIESDLVFPLIKSSMFKYPVINSFSKYVIVTQRKVREETKHLEYDVPKTWKYLNNHSVFFNNRKSSIYRNAPPFSMFGVGDYSYSKFKVGVSGFYKRPLFSVLYSSDEKPVMTDDTSYFICFEQYDMAYAAMLLLNSAEVQTFLTKIAFRDSKRPYTKKVLERLDFAKIINRLTIDDLVQTEHSLELNEYITPVKYDSFKELINLKQGSLFD